MQINQIKTLDFNISGIQDDVYVITDIINNHNEIYNCFNVQPQDLSIFLLFIEADVKEDKKNQIFFFNKSQTEQELKERYTIDNLIKVMDKVVTHNTKFPDTNESNEFMYFPLPEELGYQSLDIMHANYIKYKMLIKVFKYQDRFTSLYYELRRYLGDRNYNSDILEIFSNLSCINLSCINLSSIDTANKQKKSRNYTPTNQVLIPLENDFISLTNLASITMINTLAFTYAQKNISYNNISYNLLRIGGSNRQNAGLVNFNLHRIKQINNCIYVKKTIGGIKYFNFSVLLNISQEKLYARRINGQYEFVTKNTEYLRNCLENLSEEIFRNFLLGLDDIDEYNQTEINKIFADKTNYIKQSYNNFLENKKRSEDEFQLFNCNQIKTTVYDVSVQFLEYLENAKI